MKKFFTLVFATMLAGNMMAQMHGALTFAGASTMSVLTQNTEYGYHSFFYHQERGFHHGRESCNHHG